MKKKLVELTKSDLVFMIGLLTNCLKKSQTFEECERFEQLIHKYVMALTDKDE